MNPVSLAKLLISNCSTLYHELLIKNKRAEKWNNEICGCHLHFIWKCTNDVGIYKNVHYSISNFASRAKPSTVLQSYLFHFGIFQVPLCSLSGITGNHSANFSPVFKMNWSQREVEVNTIIRLYTEPDSYQP